MKDNLEERIRKLPGPCLIFGAGGFIGFNLFWRILGVRKDVFAVFSDPKKNWRAKIKSPPPSNVVKCNILDRGELKSLISRIKPQSVFNLSAYGAYSSQTDIDRIYKTNFNSTYFLIEELKKYGFKTYIHSGSQSEYGLNSKGPSEQSELLPNSHYAVSKTADHYLLKYYGKIEKLPVIHLRLYSVYGPWEEPNRLIPTLIRELKRGKLPKFVDPNISRDFVYVDDIVEAIITIASEFEIRRAPQKQKHEVRNSKFEYYFGEAFNICSGKKTTIRELAYLAKKIFKIKAKPKFGSMRNRSWDLNDWYGNPAKIKKVFGLKATTDLISGLRKTFIFTP